MRRLKRGGAGIAGAAALALATAALALAQMPATSQAQQPTQKVLPPLTVTAPAKKAAAPAKKKAATVKAAPTLASEPATPAPALNVVRMSPIGGSELPLDKIPAGVSLVSTEQIERAGSNSIVDVLNAHVPGATINEALGNPLATDLQYRGFSASPLNGTPQGLAIYQNGIRLNEVFGDTMNWDLIPQIAISDITVMSNNPAYGLNALGGAVNVIMKDGFSFQGATLDTRLGSFGHKQVSGEAGQRSGNWATYVAGEWIDEDGWRDLSPAAAKRGYADIGVKGSGAELHLSYTAANTHLGVVGPTPIDLVDERRANVFTSPQTFDNQMRMLNLTGALAVSKTLKLSGNVYYRSFRQKRPDGNVSEAIACDPSKVAPDAASGPHGYLCFEEDDDPLFGSGGVALANGKVPISALPNGMDTILGGNDSIGLVSSSFGGTVQAVSTERLFNLPNQLLVGASMDRGRARVKSQSELGVIDPTTLVVSGLGTIIDQTLNPLADDDDIEVTPLDLIARTQYYGFYVMNTLDVTDKLSVTVGGRYNVANIQLEDQINLTDSELTGDHTFQRFNPMAGATYKLSRGLTLYAGYSESNRAPTPAELGCADPERPCLLENFLVSDPPLKQVVGRTVEAGLRGQIAAGTDGRDALGAPRMSTINWSLGYFRTLLSDDIMTVASEVQGRGFFLNAGETLREGVEAAISYRSRRLQAYASYAYVNATFRDALVLSSPDSPVGDDCPGTDPDDEATCTFVQPGDTIPTIPRHRLKLGLDYWLTPQWRVGGEVIAVSSQFLRGDEGNDDDQLPGYAVVNLRTGYKVTDNIEVYGIVRNLLGAEYATVGTYFDTEGLRTVAGDPVGVGPSGTELKNPRMITPAAPIAVYGGLKIRF
ncbi:MAG TPA: TonB-dependent receptor [Hyphomicrobiaceae bacterium]|nr:TonB-dependent receptor [Hyphomicrobiaceae bacterium]